MEKLATFGENEVVVSYGHDVGDYIDDALKTMDCAEKEDSRSLE